MDNSIVRAKIATVDLFGLNVTGIQWGEGTLFEDVCCSSLENALMEHPGSLAAFFETIRLERVRDRKECAYRGLEDEITLFHVDGHDALVKGIDAQWVPRILLYWARQGNQLAHHLAMALATDFGKVGHDEEWTRIVEAVKIKQYKDSLQPARKARKSRSGLVYLI